MKLQKIKIEYQKNGETHYGYNYYLVLDNGNKIACKPCFAKDYAKFNIIAEMALIDKNN